MILKDYNKVLLENFNHVKHFNYILKALSVKCNYDNDIFMNENVKYEDEELASYLKMTEEDLKLELEKVAQIIPEENKKVLIELHNQLKYKMEKIDFKDLNIETLLNISKKMLFSKNLVLSLYFISANQYKDVNYLLNVVNKEYEFEMGDLINCIFSDDYLAENQSLFSKAYLKSEIISNYLRPDIFASLYLILTNQYSKNGKQRLKEIITKIPMLYENLLKAGYDKEDVDLFKFCIENNF